MAIRFLYNKKSRRLHIEGYCPHSVGNTGYIVFDSEDEALAFDGRAVSMCRLCQNKREKLMEGK